ncbi:MAG TPA: DUF6600 domain-containing protein [Bryobacteraceae bacterium]|nr:DUF6600 domain-containing protein [Bryobacteraceae bacterium]
MNLKAMSAAVAAMLAAGLLFAQDGDPGAPQGQPQGQQQGQDAPDGQYETGRAVGRISVLSGDVSVRRGDSGDVVAAAMNAPLVADDRLLTGSSSRAEVQLDYANVVRVGPGSEVRFIGMDVKSYQLQLAAGTVTFRVLRPSQAQAEIDTPSVAIHPLRQGIYRVTVRDDGTSQVTVRNGEAEVFSQAGSERLQAGQTMDARGPATDPEFQVVQAVPADAWDRWNDDRDRYLERSQSYQHVSPSISGAEDLDQYGQWVNDPTYGSVWAPTVGTDWAPYRAGRWVWEDWYGWTWVSSDPWGWAPYHYGRWFRGSFGWAWYPGPVYAPYYWSPALVGFFGYGGGFGVGFGFGGIGWVPLAPFEVFHPWWGRGFYGGYRSGVFNHTTIVNNINVVNTYRNARFAGGVTGANTADFGRRASYTSLSGSQLQSAGAVHGALPVSPDRSSLRMADRSPSNNYVQARSQNFASRMQAPRVDRVNFDQQQRSVQQMSRSNLSSERFGAGSSGVNNPAGSATHGWSRFGEPIHSNEGQQSSGNRTAAQGGGWNQSNAARQNFAATPGAAQQNFAQGARTPAANSGPSNGQAVRVNPPIVQQRTPSYSAPRYSAPAPSYSAPRSPSYSAPRSTPNFGGGGGGARPSGGGGGGHASGGGGHGGGGRR